jgi:hypothetical protein
MKNLTLTFGIVTLLGGASLAAQHSSMPPGMSHEEHRAALAMGFDQDKTVHHFLLQESGGAIVVTAKDAADAASITQIRSHFQEIAASFANGAFDKPVATHGELPPGAATMTANAALIRYRYEERADGASVVLETADPETREAIHRFLRYQIVEHKTGDSVVWPRFHHPTTLENAWRGPRLRRGGTS